MAKQISEMCDPHVLKISLILIKSISSIIMCNFLKDPWSCKNKYMFCGFILILKSLNYLFNLCFGDVFLLTLTYFHFQNDIEVHTAS